MHRREKCGNFKTVFYLLNEVVLILSYLQAICYNTFVFELLTLPKNSIVPGLTIFDAIPLTFHPVRRQKFDGVKLWTKTLQNLELHHHITNPDLIQLIPEEKSIENDKFWYFLGTLS